jgi:hypothetical protein
MSDLKTAIRKALAGSSSQTPVDTRALMSLGIKAEMTVALGEMQSSREINTALVIKGGEQTVLYWLTGATGLPMAYMQPVAPIMSFPSTAMYLPVREPKTIAKVKPTASVEFISFVQKPIKEKEKAMTTNVKQPSELNAAMMKLITDQPGIKHQRAIELALKQAPGATEKQAKKLLLNLVHASKKIRAEGPRGDVCYYLNVNGITASKPVASARKAGRRKATPVKAAPTPKPANLPNQLTCAKKQVDDDFSILLAENNDLYINKSGELFILSHDQAARVASFIHRIQAINLLP